MDPPLNRDVRIDDVAGEWVGGGKDFRDHGGGSGGETISKMNKTRINSIQKEKHVLTRTLAREALVLEAEMGTESGRQRLCVNTDFKLFSLRDG